MVRIAEKIGLVNYLRISSKFGTRAKIEEATIDDIIEALSCVHSFYDRFRFYQGGHNAHVESFKELNELNKIKKTLIYLLHGKDPYIVRMGRCIFDPEYKLKEFGQSAVQEILGWVNSENVPICNARSMKSLRWLGFDVRVPGE